MSKIVGEVSTLIKRMYLIFNYYNHFFKKIGYNLVIKYYYITLISSI